MEAWYVGQRLEGRLGEGLTVVLNEERSGRSLLLGSKIYAE